MTGKLPRILWITEHYPPGAGGMATSCARQVNGLRARGFAVDALVFEEAPEASSEKASRSTARDGGIDIHIAAQSHPGTAAQVAWRRALERTAQAGPYSHIVGFGANWPGYIAVTFAKWLGAKSAVLVRGNDFDRDLFDPRRGFYVREALGHADATGAVSLDAARRISAQFPGCRAMWTPNGIDVSRYELLPGDIAARDEIRAKLSTGGRRIVGVFGELKFKKRMPFFLAALRDAGLKDRAALLVVGRIDEEARQLLADPAISPAHKHIPFCAQDALPALYAACDYTALPSMFEGMPNVLLEAMAAGVVPIVSDAGAMANMVRDGHTGFVFRAEDRADAARAAAKAFALTDAALEKMKIRARKHVAKEFTPAKEIDALIELLSCKRAAAPVKRSGAKSKNT